jgi:hypothetical protein
MEAVLPPSQGARRSVVRDLKMALKRVLAVKSCYRFGTTEWRKQPKPLDRLSLAEQVPAWRGIAIIPQ